MRSRLVRLIVLAICFVAPLGWVAQAGADSTATVEITGEVVDTSLSLTLTTTTFSLGDVDATGNSYDPATSIAEPFTIGTNPYGAPEGIAWMAIEGIPYTVTSPDWFVVRFCSTTQSGTLDENTPLLYFAPQRPNGINPPIDYIGPNGVKACSAGHPNGAVASAGVNQSFMFYPTYIVRSTDTPQSFSATVLVTVLPWV